MVTLSSYNFQESNPPIISSNDTLTTRYRLRAKFILGDGTPFHAATSFDNNGFRLDVLPDPGTYAVTLYYITFDDTAGTQTVGPGNDVSVTVTVDAAPCPSSDNVLPGCCGPQPSTLCVCGDQSQEPDNPDLGQCSPYRVKRDCEAPKKPQPECGETTFTVTYDPDGNPRFQIVSTLYDSTCDVILDQSGSPILTIVS